MHQKKSWRILLCFKNDLICYFKKVGTRTTLIKCNDCLVPDVSTCKWVMDVPEMNDPSEDVDIIDCI